MSALPPAFTDLEPFVAQWDIEGSAARAAMRGDSTPEQRSAFFEAMEPRLGEVLSFLDASPLDELSEADQRLMNLALSYAHVNLAVEVQASDEPTHARWRPRMRLTRTAAGV